MYKWWKLKALLFEVESVTNVDEHKSTLMQELPTLCALTCNQNLRIFSGLKNNNII